MFRASALLLAIGCCTSAFGIYVAEMNRIFRLDIAPGAVVPTGVATTVVDGLPGNRLHIGRHPLSHFVFDENGDLLVNVGANTDQCADETGAALGRTCPEADVGPRNPLHAYMLHHTFEPKMRESEVW